MGTRVKIMDLELDLLTEETFAAEISGYLSNDYLNVIHFISLDYIDTYEKNELVRETLAEADLVLPGEKAILSTYHVDVLETGGMVVDYRSALRMCHSKILSGKTCYLVLRDEKEAKAVRRFFAKNDLLDIVGLYTADSDVTEEALINDINTKLPDMVLMSMESTQGEEWLHHNKGKINAKLCVVLNSMMYLMLLQNLHIPKFFKVLHMGGLYRSIAAIPYSATRRRRILLKKMDNYNNKKLLEQADVSEELSDGKEREEQ